MSIRTRLSKRLGSDLQSDPGVRGAFASGAQDKKNTRDCGLDFMFSFWIAQSFCLLRRRRKEYQTLRGWSFLAWQLLRPTKNHDFRNHSAMRDISQSIAQAVFQFQCFDSSAAPAAENLHNKESPNPSVLAPILRNTKSVKRCRHAIFQSVGQTVRRAAHANSNSFSVYSCSAL